jgi:hypothetical protein
MSFNLPGEVNPFEAPRASIGEGPRYPGEVRGDAESIRREYLGREANIKSIGHLYYLGTFFGVLGTIGAILMATGALPTPPNQQPGVDPAMQKAIMGAAALFYLVITGLNGAMGYGLTHFQVWARWTAVVFTVLGLLAVLLYAGIFSFMISPYLGLGVLAVGGGFNGLILWLLVSKKAGMVFSEEYKEIIRQTPHVKLKTSIIVKIFLVLILLAIVIPLLFGLISGLMK